jgi:hypothetical protein
MHAALAGWLAFWLGFAVLDIIAARQGVSLSEVARWVFRTDTAPGAWAFTTALTLGSLALLHHIVFGGK